MDATPLYNLRPAVGLLALAALLARGITAWVRWRHGRAAASPWLRALTVATRELSMLWPAGTLVWVCLQGAFGALTVTMKLYPAIVTAHLLGGMVLLALLALQSEAYAPRPVALPPALHAGLVSVAALAVLQ